VFVAAYCMSYHNYETVKKSSHNSPRRRRHFIYERKKIFGFFDCSAQLREFSCLRLEMRSSMLPSDMQFHVFMQFIIHFAWFFRDFSRLQALKI
jgi:hypothetical protein